MSERRYEWQSKDGPKFFSTLTQEQWRQAFNSGWIGKYPVVWLQPVNEPDKRVTFAEHVDGATKLS